MAKLFLTIVLGIAVIGVGVPVIIAVFGGKSWLENLGDWQSGLGALEGGLLGLLAILFGALYHAEETKRLDREKHEREVNAVAAAFAAEIEVIGYSLGILEGQIDAIGRGATLKAEEVWRPSLVIYRSNTQRIGMLGPDLASRVTHLASMSEELSRGVIGQQENMADNIGFAQHSKEHIRLVAEQAKDTAQRLRKVAGDPEALPLPDSDAPAKD